MQCDSHCAAADAAAQLVELRQAEALGVLDDHDRRVRHVDADLDDGGRDQDVDLPGGERVHHAVLRVLLHAAVQQRHAVGGKHLGLQMVGHLGRRLQIDLLGLLDERIDDVRLAAGVELLANELVDLVAPRLRLHPACAPACGPAAGRGSSTRRARCSRSAPACAESASPSSAARRAAAPSRAARRAARRRSGAARR